MALVCHTNLADVSKTVTRPVPSHTNLEAVPRAVTMAFDAPSMNL